MQVDTLRDVLGFKPKLKHEECLLSDYLVDTLSFDNVLPECDIAQRIIFKGRRTGNNHKFTMDVDTGYKYIQKFRGGKKWYMMESKIFLSNISFELEIENGQVVSFEVQSITFRISIKAV